MVSEEALQIAVGKKKKEKIKKFKEGKKKKQTNKQTNKNS